MEENDVIEPEADSAPIVKPDIEIPPEQKKQDLVVAQTNKIAVATDQSGILVGKTLDEQARIAKYLLEARCLPKAFTSVPKILAGMQFCFELGWNPMSGLPMIAEINGTWVIHSNGPLSLVMESGKLASIKEIFLTEDYTEISLENKNFHVEAYRAVCTVNRLGLPDPVTRSFSIQDAANAGLLRNDVWKKYPKRMLEMRARSWALKDLFPDILRGAKIAEYDMDITFDGNGKPVGDVKRDVAAEINKKYLTQAE